MKAGPNSQVPKAPKQPPNRLSRDDGEVRLTLGRPIVEFLAGLYPPGVDLGEVDCAVEKAAKAALVEGDD